MKFENGEYVCEECEGTGKLLINSYPTDRVDWKFCDACRGVGKLTWIEYVFGSTKRYPVSDKSIKEFYNDKLGYFMPLFSPVVKYKGDISQLKLKSSITNWATDQLR